LKRSNEIIGLPIIGIIEGKELGVVKNLIINPADGSVTMLIDDNKWYLGAKFLPLSAVTGVGQYAITIENSNAIETLNDAPEIESLIVADIKVIGTKVLTKNGRIQGRVTEFIVDNTGKIISCEIEDQDGKTTSIDKDVILTFGKDVLIIYDEQVTDITSQTTVTSAPPIEKKPAVSAVAPEIKTPITPVLEQIIPKGPTEDTAAKAFDDKSRKFLLGKKASRRIETDNGLIIVEKGGEITDEVLQKARLTGSLVELSMNLQ
jgi:uncharacterized protein YrrD